MLDYNLDFKSIGQQASLYAADEFQMSDHDPVVVGLALEPQRIYLPLISKDIPSPDFRIAPWLISPPDGSNSATSHPVVQWNNGDNPGARSGRYEFALTPTFQQVIYWDNGNTQEAQLQGRYTANQRQRSNEARPTIGELPCNAPMAGGSTHRYGRSSRFLCPLTWSFVPAGAFQRALRC